MSSLGRAADRHTEPEHAIVELLRPVRGALIAAMSCQALSALAGIVPLIAVVELGRVLLAPGPPDAAHAWTVAMVGAGALLVRLAFLLAAGAHNSGSVKKAVQDDVSAMHHAEPLPRRVRAGRVATAGTDRRHRHPARAVSRTRRPGDLLRAARRAGSGAAQAAA
ncbi:ATP-binding cassette, subfamily B [Actinokineospora alba]|uniref:ATP-binding cassette, subfamily B n=1 Tax=Actinokineospora alba TaxID=504798 RepID=A0A1H0TRZ8_9PSEU|nr:hypothetical protein [Actinokineospora alba]SDJ13074.1 ATP-binding cassette, subfamily B [Actinokineospora alba]SDP56408.1 ATP-binding cassette, subfamily B [Actinokineospora alba]